MYFDLQSKRYSPSWHKRHYGKSQEQKAKEKQGLNIKQQGLFPLTHWLLSEVSSPNNSTTFPNIPTSLPARDKVLKYMSLCVCGGGIHIKITTAGVESVKAGEKVGWSVNEQQILLVMKLKMWIWETIKVRDLII